MNELTSYIHVESNDSSWSNFVGCQGLACRALMIGSPRCSRGWTNGNMQTSTWSIQQDHTQTALLGLTSPGTEASPHKRGLKCDTKHQSQEADATFITSDGSKPYKPWRTLDTDNDNN